MAWTGSKYSFDELINGEAYSDIKQDIEANRDVSRRESDIDKEIKRTEIEIGLTEEFMSKSEGEGIGYCLADLRLMQLENHLTILKLMRD